MVRLSKPIRVTLLGEFENFSQGWVAYQIEIAERTRPGKSFKNLLSGVPPPSPPPSSKRTHETSVPTMTAKEYTKSIEQTNTAARLLFLPLPVDRASIIPTTVEADT